VWPAAAQQPSRVWRVGVLTSVYAPDSERSQPFRQQLRALGYLEGQNLVIDWRNADGRDDRLPGLAAELVRLKPDILVADATLAIRAAMQASATIPIVMTNSADPVAGGLVPDLRHPGGNATGVTTQLAELAVKRMQLLKEAVPKVSRVAVLWNPGTPYHQSMLREIEAAAPSLHLQPIVIPVKTRDDLGDALAPVAKSRAEALLVSQNVSPQARKQLLDFAAKHRLPAMFQNRDYVAEGGLMSYAPNFPDLFRRAAVYVDKILKGAKPGDLPVEQPTKFELLINMKTTRALGIAIPPEVLLRADEVIE